jgi:hypothetical protein
MTNGAKLIRFAVILICSALIVYLTWIGSQYVCYHNVTLDITDNLIVWALAWYITRDIVDIDDKLRKNGGK